MEKTESVLSLNDTVYEEEKKLTFEITVFYCTLVLCDKIKEYSVDYTLQIFEMIHSTFDSHRTR